MTNTDKHTVTASNEDGHTAEVLSVRADVELFCETCGKVTNHIPHAPYEMPWRRATGDKSTHVCEPCNDRRIP